MSLMSFGGKSNAMLKIGRRLIQPDEEWKDKCAAFTELRDIFLEPLTLQSESSNVQESAAAEDATKFFTPENVQALTQPFRVTLTDLRSTVVKEACITLSLLAQKLGPLRCKILVRDVFPTLLDARGGSNKVNTTAIHNCIETIVIVTPSRFVLAPVLQVLNTSKNREVRESCIHYTCLALEGWNSAILERFRIPLQSAIAAALSDASPKGREKARDCYWNYVSIWPHEAERITDLLVEGVKKHLKRSRDKGGIGISHQPSKRRHLVTITNTVSLRNAANTAGNNAHPNELVIRSSKQTKYRAGTKLRSPDKKRTSTVLGTKKEAIQSSLQENERTIAATDAVLLSQIPLTPPSALRKLWTGDMPSNIPTPCATQMSTTLFRQHAPIHNERKCVQLKEENALLLKQLKTKAHQFKELREQIQVMDDEKQQSESKHKAVMAATMDAHARDTATQRQIQFSLAEQLANQEEELERMRNWQKSSILPVQPSPLTMRCVKNKSSSLSEQPDVTTAEVQALVVKTSDEMKTSKSNKSSLEEPSFGRIAQMGKLQAKQYALVAAIQGEKRILAARVDCQSEALLQYGMKAERATQLGRELSFLLEQLQATTAKLETSNAEAGHKIGAVQSEKSTLDELLSVQNMQLEELQAKQYSLIAAIGEENRMLTMNVSPLNSGGSKVLTQYVVKDDCLAQLARKVSSLLEQLQATTAKLEASNAGAGHKIEALRSEKSNLEEHLSAQKVQLEELQAKQYSVISATEEMKHVVAMEVFALKSSQSEALTRCDEKDKRLAHLEGKLSSLSEQLQATTAKLQISKAEAGYKVEALQREKSDLEEHLSIQSMQLEEVQARQYSVISAIAEEKRVLAMEVSALNRSQAKALTQCNEKDKRLAQLEGKLSSLSEQLQATTEKLQVSKAEAGHKIEALQSEKSDLEEHLSAQSMHLEEHQAKQYSVISAIAEEKRVLAMEVSALNGSQAEALTQCNEKNKRLAQLEREMSSLSEQLQAITWKLQVSKAEADHKIEALQSEKSDLEEHSSAQSMPLEEAKQYSVISAIEEEKRVLAMEVSALNGSQAEALTQCDEKNKRLAQLEREMSSLSEQLQATTEKLQVSKAEAGHNIEALQSEKSDLEEHLSVQSMHLEEHQAKQYSVISALEEEKRVLVSALKSSQSEALTQCDEKDKRLAQLEGKLSSLSEQLQATTEKLQVSKAEAGHKIEALQSEKSDLEEHLSAQSMHLEEHQAKQYSVISAIAEEKRVLAMEVSALNRSQAKALTQCNEKDKRLAQLEGKLSSLSEQLQATTEKLQVSKAEAGHKIEALQSEKSDLEEHLSAQSMQLEEVQARQYSVISAIAEEKRVLAMEVSALNGSQAEALTQCDEKNKRLAQLEREMSSLLEQLQATTGKLQVSKAEAGHKIEALQSEKSDLKEHLSAQSMQLEELQAKQYSVTSAIEEEKRVLVSALKSSQSEALTQCDEKDKRLAQLEGKLSSLSEQLQATTGKLQVSKAEAGHKIEALQSEKSDLEEHSSAQSMQLEELQAKHFSLISALEKEKRMLAMKVSASNGVHAMLNVNSAEVRYAACNDAKQNPLSSCRTPLSVGNTRDRIKLEAEERRMNDTNVSKRKLRRQNCQELKHKSEL